jgi:DNA-binding response OmpR family regulator
MASLKTAKTIMVVDDDADIRITLKTVLEKHGYKIVTAANGDDALKKLKNQNVNLILLDIMMPGTPVREIIKKTDGIKVAYLTAVRLSEAEREELLKRINIVGFIQKPFDIKDLVDKIKRIIG